MANVKWTNEQLQAINEDNKNIIVSAGAGSGKTAVLTERIIRILKSGVKANELLVLTFTNAAAAEMKNRVVEKMQDDPMLESRIDEVENAYITTFDSYAFSIVRHYHYLLDLSKNVQIIDSSIIVLKEKEILDDIFNALYASNDVDFLEMIDNFTNKDDASLIKEILDMYNKKVIYLINKDEVLDNYDLIYGNHDKIKSYVDTYLDSINEQMQIIKDNYDDLRSYLLRLKQSNTVSNYLNMIDNLVTASDYDTIKQIITNPAETPRNKTETGSETIAKANVLKAISTLKELCYYPSLSHIYKSLENSLKYQKVIVRILKELDTRIQEYKKYNESFEFVDIANMALKLVIDHEDIKNELQSQYKEIMIDEYQDTNDLQDTFISYIANDNVYVVGDVKQSIYRFRNANPTIFVSKYDKYGNPNYDKGLRIDLNKNFRSNHEVIDMVNKIFDKLMIPSLGGVDYQKEHQLVFGLEAYNDYHVDNCIELITYENDDKLYKDVEIEMFHVAYDINKKIENKVQVYDPKLKKTRDCKYEDFAILVSSLYENKKEASDIQKCLEYYNIPTLILKKDNLLDSDLFSVFLNIFNLIHEVYHNQFTNLFKKSYYGLGRSFLFNYSDEELYFQLKNNTYKETELYQKIDELVKKVDILSNDNFILEVVNVFDFYNSIITVGRIDSNIDFINAFYDMAKNLSSIDVSILELGNYLQSFKDNGEKIEITSSAMASDKVKIMTIHKSKGLEFPFCYFLHNHSNINTSDIRARFIFDSKYGVITPFYDEGIGETITKSFVKKDFYLENLAEKIRLFYVALTRCREHMIILCKENKKPKEELENCKSFNDLIYYAFDCFGGVCKNIIVDDLEIHRKYLNIKETKLEEKDLTNTIKHHEINIKKETLQKQEASKTVFEILTSDRKKIMQTGTRYHELFELCDFKNFNPSIYDNEQKLRLQSFLNQEVVKNIKDATIYKELPFIYQEDDSLMHGVIDLALEYDDHVDIIDYKLKHTADEAYKKQLLAYKNYIASVINKPINTYLYSIMDNQMVKIDV